MPKRRQRKMVDPYRLIWHETILAHGIHVCNKRELSEEGRNIERSPTTTKLYGHKAIYVWDKVKPRWANMYVLRVLVL